MEKKKKGKLHRLLQVLLGILLVIIGAAAVLILVLTVVEYKPADRESVEVIRGAADTTDSPETLTVMSWNIGYGALGDNADFFMDGGSSVYTATKERVAENMDGILETLEAVSPDILFLQEIDRDSDRSYHTDELEAVTAAFPDMDHAFANNFKVLYIPYPLPPMGKVDSGVAPLSVYPLAEAERISLPCPFSWPVRLANLKRCLLVSRIDLDDEDGRQLVLVNLHLEAYDSGEGKIAQTKMLAQFLQEEADKGNYVIAGGDFNQIFSGADGSAWPAQDGKWIPGELDETQFADGWQFLMDNSAPTCRSLDQPYEGADVDTFQFYLIDGFIVSENVTVNSCETRQLDFADSDHDPVILEVTLD